MKRIPLLLAALGLVSAAAYAEAPALRVTSVGQEVEIEHTNGTDGTTAWLYNNVGLSYEDWTFGLKGSKQWKYSDKNDNIKANDSRLDLEAWKKINDDLKLGVKYRGHDDHARYMVMYNYTHGMFLSNGDFWYQVNENGNDALRAEWFPIGVKIGPVTLKYLADYSKTVGTIEKDKQKSSLEHQLRAYAPLYKGERFSVNTEIRHTLHVEKDMDNNAGYEVYDDFGRTRVYLKTSYAMTENLNVYANYAYQIGKYDARDGYPKRDNDKEYYQNFTFGWTYTF